MNALTSINIGDTIIRQTATNQYCINDLHKAAGTLSKDQPSKFLILDSTKELINELLMCGNLVSEQIQPVITLKGGNGAQGTYVVKELVYAYAMWISPAFSLKVIRTFDAVVTGSFIPTFNTPMTLTQLQENQALLDDAARRLNKAQVLFTVEEFRQYEKSAKKQQYDTICGLVKDGMSRQQIADELAISRNNVRQIIFHARKNGDLTAEEGVL